MVGVPTAFWSKVQISDILANGIINTAVEDFITLLSIKGAHCQ